MSRLAKYTQKLFGSSAGTNTMSQFGSLFASYPSVPTRYSGATITPALVQALSNYLTGWTGAAIGGNSPAIEDMNALCFLFSYQIAYTFQAGIPEWDSSTTYYVGSFASDGAGNLYTSLVDNNTNHALTDQTKWIQTLNGTAPTGQRFLSTGSTTGYYFICSSGSATAGATYTNNGHTYTVIYTVSGGTRFFMSGALAPTSSGTLTKSGGTGDATLSFSSATPTGTYTTPANCKYIRIRMVGGGGGGSGAGTGSQTAGTNGSDTQFGNDFIAGGGGGGPTGDNGGGFGGSAFVPVSFPGAWIGVNGGYGGGGNETNTGTTTSVLCGGMGGVSYFGGGGGTSGNAAGGGAAANSGSGGGAGGVLTASATTGGGGGAGAYCEFVYTLPAGSYPYYVGTAGGGGTHSGAGTFDGGPGAAGAIYVDEFYQ